MRLNKEDKARLKAMGHSDSDMEQLQAAANKTKYEMLCVGGAREVGVREVIDEIGRDEWLAGISRSAFHWSATRFNNDKSVRIDFDSSAVWE